MSVHLIKNIEELNNQLDIDFDFYNKEFKNNKISTEKVFEKNFSKIDSLRKQIIVTFQRNDLTEKHSIWNIVSSNRYILKFLTYKVDFNNDKEFKDIMILEIFRNFHNDPRDIFLYFGVILKKAKETKTINLKEILTRILPLADDNNWTGMGSMKTFLENIIKYNLD